jgi:decaprenyl-phosphate phosphoribosyltransferase
VSSRGVPISEPDLLPDAEPRSGSIVGGIVRTARPRQWIKNLLVFAAPIAGGVVLDPGHLIPTLWAFAAFCLSASAVYFVNDALDVEADRAHPKKRTRPIAAGILPVPAAYAIAVVLFAAGLALAFIGSLPLLITIACYDLIQLAYCLWLKHMAVVDIAVVSSGFLLRTIAGGVASDIELSQWFLLVAVFGSLLIVAGKRYAEILANPDAEGEVRGSLKAYTPSYLAFVWQAGAAILILGYTLWAFSLADGRTIWAALSVAPFVLAVLRYAQHIDRGDAEAP